MGRGRDRVGPQAACIVGAGGGGLKVVLDGYVERIATRQKHLNVGGLWYRRCKERARKRTQNMRTMH